MRPKSFGRKCSDLAPALNAEGVLFYGTQGSDPGFEEAVFEQNESKAPAGRSVASLRYRRGIARGQNDVESSPWRKKDAEGIYRFLQGRGVVAAERNVYSRS